MILQKLDASFKAQLLLKQWDRFSLAECEEITRDLDRILPASFRFHIIKTCSFSDQKHHIAIFEWAGLPEGYYKGFFALIPGGQATLGYDREHPFVPDQQQQASWVKETQETGMFTGTLAALLDLTMTPLRHISLEPFLLEVLALPLSPAAVFDETLGKAGGWTRSPALISYKKTLQRLSREGLRFPTSDEWEYACAAGSRTLFRWGDMTPPFSIPALGRQKAAGWDLHLQQNTFGLLIARYPYHWEFCAEPGLMRGGDGGTALHAGIGTFAAWLTLASAFHRLVDANDNYGVYLRRAFSLS
ncbi:MAG: formylglycine-generating enzyme family protein [Chloroflexota bacterium]|nr:formylglycine-generating enzyme family protein [Chloroflexota bacterium]